MDFKPESSPSHNVPEEWREPEPPWPPPPKGKRFDLGFKSLLIFNVLFLATVYTTWAVGGPWFSLSLLLILATHEFGHYFACRANNVDASLPNFIPAPPFFLVGTFGAFIRIKEPITNRRALMEIGASGPLAGFVVAVPVLLWGLSLSEVQPPNPSFIGFRFGESLLTKLFAHWVLDIPWSADVSIEIHPMAYAGWFGMFITAMNLLPISQLDGGHVIFSLFPRHHIWVARLFFALLIVLGFYWPGWYVLAFLVLLIGLRHPPIIEWEDELKARHRWMGYACIGVFIFTFIPIPIEWVGA